MNTNMNTNIITFSKARDVKKGWGKEVQIFNSAAKEDSPTGLSGKLLVYTEYGAVSSMHFHRTKSEVFYVLSGRVQFKYYNLDNADEMATVLVEGDVVTIPPGNPHQIISLEPSTIIEFASTDYSWDNYRVRKGDSQRER